MEMWKPKMLVVFHDLSVRKDEKSEACILIFLTTNLSSYSTFKSLDFSLLILLFIYQDATTATFDTLLYSNLPPDCIGLLIFWFYEWQCVEMLLECLTFAVQVVVISNDSCSNKATATSDGVHRIQLSHALWDFSLKRVNTFIGGQVSYLNGIVGNIAIMKVLHGIQTFLPGIVLFAEHINHDEGEGWNNNYCSNEREYHFVMCVGDIKNCSCTELR